MTTSEGTAARKPDPELWRSSTRQDSRRASNCSRAEIEQATITGRLDKVDLRARRFRVRDDVGNDVALDDVLDVGAAAQLIGQRVVARGVAEREGGKLVRILEPVLEAEELPAGWPSQPTLGAPLRRSAVEQRVCESRAGTACTDVFSKVFVAPRQDADA